MGFIDEKVLKNLFNVTIVLVALFFIAISFYLVKVSNNDYCGVSNNPNIIDNQNVIYDTVINDSNDYLLQEMSISKQEINYYEYYNFCFNSMISTNDNIEINIINDENIVLGKTFLVNDYVGVTCVEISDDLCVDNNFLGVKCVNCDSDNNITIASSLSNNEITLTNDGDIVSDSLDYNIIGVKNCKGFVKELFKWLITFVLLMSLIPLINLFVDWLRGFSFDGW